MTWRRWKCARITRGPDRSSTVPYPSQGIRTFPDRSFNVVIHDPPARALCRTDLYSVEFYNELYRVLTRNGVLYHYIGNPDSKESGRLYSGIVSRLTSAGFMRIERVPKAFGVVAYVS